MTTDSAAERGSVSQPLPHNATSQIRGRHPYAFRSGEWADLLSVTRHARGRECYAVRFSDGTSDFWPVDDELAGYEFRAKTTTTEASADE